MEQVTPVRWPRWHRVGSAVRAAMKRRVCWAVQEDRAEGRVTRKGRPGQKLADASKPSHLCTRMREMSFCCFVLMYRTGLLLKFDAVFCR